jgi:pimeloyl-ACP methyl ester carboxylesterase
MCGLIVISPSCQRSSWWEWAWGNTTSAQLYYRGWTGDALDHFAQRLFGEHTRLAFAGESEAIKAFRREAQTLDPLAVRRYLKAVISRPDISGLIPQIACRLLLIYGGESLYRSDCIELATKVNKSRFAVMEVQGAGTLANEERASELPSPIELFLTALQLEGYALSGAFMVGE